MSFTPDDVLRLGGLARIELTPEDAARLAPQLDAVEGYVQRLADDQAVHAMPATPLRTVLSADVPGGDASFVRELAIAAVPSMRGGLIEVPAVLGGGAA